MKRALKLGLFGRPGAGKGTQAEHLAKYLGCPHISTGDMFRALGSSSSELARDITKILEAGLLVPDELVTRMTFERLSKPDAFLGYVLDGFPRTLVQAVALQESSYALDALIEIKVDKDEIIKRLSGRLLCKQCQTIYHIKDLPVESSTCIKCQSELLQRDDDRPEAVVLRLDIFENNFSPIINFFKKRGLLLSIDGHGFPDEVFKRLLKGLEQIEPGSV